MILPTSPPVDTRDVNALLSEFQTRQPAYLPRWTPAPKSAGAAIGPIFARLIASILQRLNQAPGKEKIAFLDLLGLRLVPAQSARAPIVFSLTQGAADTSAPEGTQVAAPPPPGSSQQVVFSTEHDAAVAGANLTEVVSLWPGRDQYINHSSALAAKTPFILFQNLQLTPTGHVLYLAHSKFLAFAGTAIVKVSFDLTQASTSPLDITWEYWDGQVWRGFIPNQATCLDPVQTGFDGTNGLSASACTTTSGGNRTAAPSDAEHNRRQPQCLYGGHRRPRNDYDQRRWQVRNVSVRFGRCHADCASARQFSDLCLSRLREAGDLQAKGGRSGRLHR